MTAVAAALVMSASAQAQTNTFTAGTQYVTPALTSSVTLGSQMTGMLVSWSFAGGGGGSAVWGSISGSHHGVIGTDDFRIRMLSSGDSFETTWELRNSSTQRLAWIRFNGAPGNVMFDCDWLETGNPPRCDDGIGPGTGSPGSIGGHTLTSAGGSFTGSVFGEYTNAVSIGNAAPVGDLFEQLTIRFGGSMGAGDTYVFYADTDSGSLNQVTTVVPEPRTYGMLAAGLAMMVAARRRRMA